ncbi:MAG: PD40 domain-containing protein [Anaerolineales bacterium]|nr:PD40 domain-containing protein [Anaerolineales bacterium]
MPASITQSTLEKFTTFGDLLRFLRRRIGITQIELATAVSYSDTQISRLEQNLRLPDIPTIEARFITALGLEHESHAVARLLDLAANVRREDAPSLGLCPYKGLNYFDESDADLFVGREALTTNLTERVLSLVSRNTSNQQRFLAIVGASGSGKSSLIRAGLASALRWNKVSTDWHIHVLTPTAHPLESLASGLTDSVSATTALMDDLSRDERSLQIFIKRKLGPGANTRVLLVIDQFEELFALCRSEEERASFIDNLLAAASETDGPVIVVITLRADFYAPCANYPPLREALARSQEYIGVMNNEELRQAIEEPARRGRWELEPGLIDLLLHDVGHEPGALPLLSHALFETWQRRRGRMMTLSGYASSGGVRGAIAETAETVFSDQFTHEQRTIARRIFLRLTELGDDAGAGDTRRRAKFSELILKPEESAITHAVLKALADARLITTTENAAEVAHEALIREWPTLHGWLEENREELRLHHQLTEAAQEWIDMEREPDILYRGARLAQTQEWALTHQDEMNELEMQFLEAAIQFSEREVEEREAQRQRELESSRKLAEVEHQRAEEQVRNAGQLKRRERYLVSVLGIAIIAAVTAGIFANRNNTLALQNVTIAQTAQAASTQAIADFNHSEAQRLAAEANSLMLNNGDTNVIALLSIRSLNMQYTPAGDAVLTSLTNLAAPPREFSGHTDYIYGVAISPDGKYLATGSVDQTVRLWDMATGETIRVLTGHTYTIDGVVFSPDGKYLLSGSHDGTARLWEVATGQTVKVFPTTISMGNVAFSPDGKYFAAAYADSIGRIWDVTTGQIVHTLAGHTDLLTRVAYSPDGKYVLTGSGDNTARLWDSMSGEQVQVFAGHTHGISAVAFSPDGKTIATGDDASVRLWDISTAKVVQEFSGHQTWISGIQFSPDGRFLFTGSGDRTARLWDISTGKQTRIFGGNTDFIQDVAFSADGALVATVGNDKIARVWNLQASPEGVVFIGHGGAVGQASFSPDGRQIVTANEDGTARIWDAATGQTMITLIGHIGIVRGAVFSPDGKMALTASEDRTARLWDVMSGKELLRFEGHTDVVYRAVFSPNARYIVTASWDNTARVWDTETGKTILIFRNQDSAHVNRVAFSSDGTMVATSGDDDTARIWEPLTGKDLMIFKHDDGVTGVDFSPDGKYLVTGSYDGSVQLWDVANGNQVRLFMGHRGWVFNVVFSPDGKHILSSGADATARLWDVQTGKEVRRFLGHTNEVRNGSFSLDGKYILTASNDGSARLWLTDYRNTIDAVCALLTRDLTSDERLQFGITDQGSTCPVH